MTSFDQTAADLAPHAPQDTHIVDVLIEERAPRLRMHPLWPAIRAVLYPLLGYRPARRMADEIRDLSGPEVMQHMSRLLSVRTQVSGLEHIPREGAFILAPNHPTGIVDGIAVWDVLRPVRPDMTFFANRDAIRVAARLDEVVIPVEWVVEKRTRERSRETLKSAVDSFRAARAVVLFPSGRISFMSKRKELTEQPWTNTVVSFAHKFDCPVVPVYMQARNSWLYYLFWELSPELRDMTLFHELLNKKKKLFTLTIGAPIPASQLTGAPDEVAARLRAHTVEDLPAGVAWNPARPAPQVDLSSVKFRRDA